MIEVEPYMEGSLSQEDLDRVKENGAPAIGRGMIERQETSVISFPGRILAGLTYSSALLAGLCILPLYLPTVLGLDPYASASVASVRLRCMELTPIHAAVISISLVLLR